MARSEAQKAADRRYAEKIKGRYERFVVLFRHDELEYVNAEIAKSGMSKADFVRWAVEQLKNK